MEVGRHLELEVQHRNPLVPQVLVEERRQVLPGLLVEEPHLVCCLDGFVAVLLEGVTCGSAS
jgi:hypothetical protein